MSEHLEPATLPELIRGDTPVVDINDVGGLHEAFTEPLTDGENPDTAIDPEEV